MSQPTPSQAPSDVLVLDGDCGLCTHLALFLRPRLLQRGALDFVGQASPRGAELLGTLPERQQQMDTVVLLRGGRSFVRSAAIVRLGWYLRWHFRVLAALLWCVPLPLRDLGYRLVAHYRKRLWAPPDTCAF